MVNIWMKGTARIVLRVCKDGYVTKLQDNPWSKEAVANTILEPIQQRMPELMVVAASKAFESEDVGFGQPGRPDIFQKLLDVDETPEGILKFVNEFGLLTGTNAQPLREIYAIRRRMRRVLAVGRARGPKRIAKILGSFGIGRGEVSYGNHDPEVLFYLDHLREFLWLELFYAMKAGIVIMKCADCKEAFIPDTAMGPDPTYCRKCSTPARKTKRYRDANKMEINRKRNERRAAQKAGLSKIDPRLGQPKPGVKH
jgi:hypothetical protein